jgi:hypothetical protein
LRGCGRITAYSEPRKFWAWFRVADNSLGNRQCYAAGLEPEVLPVAASYFPEALNQGHTTLTQWLKGESIIVILSLMIGCIGYAATLVLLGLMTAFARRVPFPIMHTAAMYVGVGSAALLGLYFIPQQVLGKDQTAAIVGISLSLSILALTVALAVRVVWRNVFAGESRQI